MGSDTMRTIILSYVSEKCICLCRLSSICRRMINFMSTRKVSHFCKMFRDVTASQSRQRVLTRLFLQSSKLPNWDSPHHPHTLASVPPPPLVPGWGTHSLGREGVGGSQFGRRNWHYGTLGIQFVYFVLYIVEYLFGCAETSLIIELGSYPSPTPQIYWWILYYCLQWWIFAGNAGVPCGEYCMYLLGKFAYSDEYLLKIGVPRGDLLLINIAVWSGEYQLKNIAGYSGEYLLRILACLGVNICWEYHPHVG